MENKEYLKTQIYLNRATRHIAQCCNVANKDDHIYTVCLKTKSGVWRSGGRASGQTARWLQGGFD